MKPIGIHLGVHFHPGGSCWSGAQTRHPHVLMWACVCVCVLTEYLWVSDFSLFFGIAGHFHGCAVGGPGFVLMALLMMLTMPVAFQDIPRGTST